MKWSLHKYNLTGLFYGLVLVLISSCDRNTLENVPVNTGDGNVISISARGLGAANDPESAIRTLRLLVFAEDTDEMLLNSFYYTSEATSEIPADKYVYFANIGGTYRISELLPKKCPIKVVLIANEPTSLDGVYTLKKLKGSVLDFYNTFHKTDGTMDIVIGSNFNANKGYIPMYAESDLLAHHSWDASYGQIVPLSLERVLAKVTLRLRAEIPNSIPTGESITINSASILFVPKFSFLGDRTTPYEASQISVSTQTFNPQITVTSTSSALSTNQLVFYLPEHTLSQIAFENSKYTYLQINATHHADITGEYTNSIYKIPLGDGVHKLYDAAADINSLSMADLSISRNTTYNIDARIATIGKLELFQVKLEVEKWQTADTVNGSINAPLLNITSANVKMSQDTVRVHFWSNQPQIYIEATGKKGTTPVQVNDIFEELSGTPGVSTARFKLFSYTDNPYLPYNGYMDIKFKKPETYNLPTAYTLVINAGGLKREISVEANPVVGEVVFDANGGTGTLIREIRYSDLNRQSLTGAVVRLDDPGAGLTAPPGKTSFIWIYSSGEAEVPTGISGGTPYCDVKLSGYTTKIKAQWY